MPRRPAQVMVTTAVAAMILAGCGTKENNHMPDDTPMTTGLITPAPLEGRPPMNEMLDHYRKVVDEVITAVDNAYGPLGWSVKEGAGESRGSCESGIDPDKPTLPDGEVANLATRVAANVPPAGAADDVRAVIEQATGKHGFTHFQVMEQTDTAFHIFAYDRYDTRLSFGYGKASAMGLQTGCFPLS